MAEKDIILEEKTTEEKTTAETKEEVKEETPLEDVVLETEGGTKSLLGATNSTDDIAATSLDTKTTPAGTDNLILFNQNTNVGYQIDYDNLADAILNKLTSKTFTNQVGGSSAATLLAQLATLNSNIVYPYLQAATTELTQSVRYGTGDIAQKYGTVIDGNNLYVFGRTRINNFVRTGDQPGVTIALPDGYAVDGDIGYNSHYSLVGGINGVGNSIRARETTCVYAYNNGTNVYVCVTESYTNVSNGDFWMVVPIICIKLKRT